MGRVTSVLDARGLAYRRQILEILLKAKRGHIGSAFSILEIVRVLYDEVLKVDPKRPQWADRDRFILSKGHGCLALYVLLAEKGFFDPAELNRFSSATGILGGHPEHITVPGVEASTGSLGHGLSIGVGMALAAKMDRAAWRVFAIIGDGESQEGSIWEAALSAAKHRLDNLTVILDYNKMQCYSAVSEILGLEPLADKWRSFGFAVREIDGHNIDEIRSAFAAVPLEKNKPSLILAHTLKGKGVPELEQNPDWHHKAKVSAEELKPFLEYLSGSAC
jgi:transketolase